jgi:hypothetical protein
MKALVEVRHFDSLLLLPLLLQAALKSELMKALVEEQQRSVVHKVCDTVSELAADCLDKGAWPEVLPALQVGLQQTVNPVHLLFLCCWCPVFLPCYPKIVACVRAAGAQQQTARTRGHCRRCCQHCR